MIHNKKTKNILPVAAAMRSIIEKGMIFQEEEEGYLPVKFLPGTQSADLEESREMVIVGDNGAGKSLIRQLLAGHYRQKCKAAEVTFEGIEISMGTRAGGGMRGAFMYGPHQDDSESSGRVSLGPLTGLFNTSKGRDHRVLMMVDEVEVALSPSLHHAMGVKLAKLHKEYTLGQEHILGLMIVTHSRDLVAGFQEEMGYWPHALMLEGALDMTLQQWVEAPVKRKTYEELENFPAMARARRRSFERFFKSE